MRQMSRRALLTAGTGAAAISARKPAMAGAEGLVGLIEIRPPVAPPDIRFTDVSGTVHGLTEYLGSGVVLNLWATWCAPCVAELPSLAVLAKTLADRKVKVLPLSSDHGGAAAVTAFYQQHAITGLPVLLDPQGAALRALGAQGIPTTFIIDRKGLERGQIAGGSDWGSEAAVQRVLQLVGG